MIAARWLSLSASAVALLVGCKPANQFVPPPPPEVDAAAPTEGYVTEYLQFTGTTRAVEEVEIRARVTGYLKEINFEDGATVSQGDVLFVIEPEPFEATLAEAQAGLDRADAAVTLSRTKVGRRAQLIQQGSTLTREEYDVAQADLATAQADLALAEATRTKAQLNLDYTEVNAPISGRIGRHLVDVGNLVEAQTTALTTIESVDEIYAYFDVSDSDVVRLMQFDEAPTRLTLATDRTNFRYEGTVDWTALGVNPDTRTQQRRGRFKNADGRLLSGMFVRIRMEVGEPQKKILVEERAVGGDQRGDYVLVLSGPGEFPDTLKVEYRPVTLGIAQGDRRAVEKGLSPTDIVIVNGLQRARPGGSVKLSKVSKEALQKAGVVIPIAPLAPAPEGPKTPPDANLAGEAGAAEKVSVASADAENTVSPTTAAAETPAGTPAAPTESAPGSSKTGN